MILIEPTMEFDKEIQAFRQEFINAGGTMDGCGSLKSSEYTEDWIKQIELLRREETAPMGWVPSTQYIFVREVDRKICGAIQIRHYLNEYLQQFSGHIGYSVCPSERRKGIATRMLKEILPKCKELGIYNVKLSCVKENVGSKRVILKNGGIYERTVFEPKEQMYLEQYRIVL